MAGTIKYSKDCLLGYCGEYKTLAEWAKITGLTCKAISKQLIDGIELKQVLTNNLDNDGLKRLAAIVDLSTNKAMNQQGEVVMAEENEEPKNEETPVTETETVETPVVETEAETTDVEETEPETTDAEPEAEMPAGLAEEDEFEDEFEDEDESTTVAVEEPPADDVEADEEPETEEEAATEETTEASTVKATATSTPAATTTGAVKGKGKKTKVKAEKADPKKRGRTSGKPEKDAIVVQTVSCDLEEGTVTMVRKKSSQIKVFKATEDEILEAIVEEDDVEKLTLEVEEKLTEVAAKPYLRKVNTAEDLGVSEDGHNTRQFGKKVMDALEAKYAPEPEADEPETAEVETDEA